MTTAGAAWRFWRATRARRHRDLGYGIYLAVMLGLVAVAPLARGVWLVATDAALASVVTTFVGGATIPVAILTAWAACLTVGSVRGPVVASPFLAHTLSDSALPLRGAFRRQIWLPVGILAALGAAIAGVLSLAWGAVAGPAPLVVVAAVVIGAGSGVVAGTLWLAGQAVPLRHVGIGASALLAFAAAVLLAASPGIGALAMPDAVLTSHAGAIVTAALAVTALAALGIPRLARHLDPAAVVAHSLQWERATAHAGTLDLSGSAATYQPVPRRGRRRTALPRARGLGATILHRDAVAATRMPGRLLVSVVVLVVGGVLLGLAVSGSPALGAVAGALVYGAAGAVSDGIRHVVDAAATLPLYGVNDARMLSAHAAFPLLALLAALGTGAVIAAILASTSLLPALVAVVLTTVGSVALRVGSALKPSLPIALLAPMPTPAGDLSPLIRAAWALDGVILALAIGVAASVAAVSILPIGLTLAAVAGVVLRRWHRR